MISAMKKDTGNTSVQEMEQIQRGLEEFLQKEMQEMEKNGSNRQKPPEPQFFTIEEEEEREKELTIIGTQSRPGRKGRRPEEDYAEDWDGGERRRDARSAKTDTKRQNRRTSDTGKSDSRKPKEIKSRQTRSKDGQSDRMDSRKSTVRKSGKKKAKQTRYREEDQRESGNRSGKAQSRSKKGGDKKKKKFHFKRFLVTVAVILALLGVGLYYLVGMVYGKMNYKNIEALASAPMKEDGVVNILLIGNDSRENGEDGRSDAMILVSVSTRTKKIYMTSLLRDMYVEIPGHDGNRLNAAYSFGGAELLMDTIEKNLDISVNRYVLVNFEAFANLVDAVGGVELELTSQEVEYVNGYLVEYNMLTDRPQGTDNMDTSVSGLVHLNGPQALAYSRNRYLGTDFGRTQRQRKVLAEVIRKLPGTIFTNPKGLIDGLMPNLTTNLTQMECFRLSLMADKLLSYEIVQDNIPIEGSYKDATIRKMQVLEVDFEANKKYLREKVYGEGAPKVE